MVVVALHVHAAHMPLAGASVRRSNMEQDVVMHLISRYNASADRMKKEPAFEALRRANETVPLGPLLLCE